MKRFHVHIRVSDLESNLVFYTHMFGKQADVIKSDYAKWMLDQPRINFALSTHGNEKGVNHLGFEFDTQADLTQASQHFMHATADAAKSATLDQGKEQADAKCCYARSNKHWLLDPQGVPWEIFHSYDTMNEYGNSDTKASILDAESCSIEAIACTEAARNEV